jgi:ligand-binding sensor domain-containing protein
MAYDSDGELLLLTPAGLVRVVDGKLGPPEALPWPASGGDLPKVRRILVDREGNRWVGTIGSGLLRFRRTPLIAYGSEEGLANSSFSALFQDREGRFWMGGDLLYWFYGSQFHLFPGIDNIRAISQTRDGAMWFGGYGGLFRWSGGVLKHFNIEAPAVRTIYEDAQGTLWIGTIMEDHPGGLYRLREGKFEQIPGISDVRKVVEDRQGGLWIGGLQGLWHFRDGKNVLYDQTAGLSNNAVYDIYQDHDQGRATK